MDIFQTQKKIAKSSWMPLNLAQIFSGSGREVFPESFYKGGSPRFFFFLFSWYTPHPHHHQESGCAHTDSQKLFDSVPASAGSPITSPGSQPQHHRHRRLKGIASNTDTDVGPCKALISATLLTRLSEVAPGTWPTQPCIPAPWLLSSSLKRTQLI